MKSITLRETIRETIREIVLEDVPTDAPPPPTDGAVIDITPTRKPALRAPRRALVDGRKVA